MNAKKTERINLRISEEVLNKLKEEAAKLGIPYQTHINSVLFQYSNQKASKK